MKNFAALFTALDQTTKTSLKVAAMAEYFRTASDADKLWCVALFSGRRPKRVITTKLLREWAMLSHRGGFGRNHKPVFTAR